MSDIPESEYKKVVDLYTADHTAVSELKRQLEIEQARSLEQYTEILRVRHLLIKLADEAERFRAAMEDNHEEKSIHLNRVLDLADDYFANHPKPEPLVAT